MQYDPQQEMVPHDPLAERLTATAPNLHAELLAYLDRHRDTLFNRVRNGGPASGLEASAFAARMYDGLLDTLFRCASAILAPSPCLPRRALGAVGSYARSTLGLHSDIDVRIIVEQQDDQAEELARVLLYPLWDVRVSVGYQVVDIASLIDLAATDLRTATALLDWRHLCGDEGLSQELTVRAESGLFRDDDAAGFIERLETDTANRHERFGASVYLLEPDIKQGAGGLRDLDVALWVAKARWKASRFEDLVRLGVFVPRELNGLLAAQAHLCRVRNQLHLLAARRSDRLSFDRQETIASRLGYGDHVEGAERLMSEHYQHAQRICHARELIVGRALEKAKPLVPARRICPGLMAADDQIAIESTSALAFEPALALSVFQHAVMRRMRLRPTTREILRRALRLPNFRQAVRESPDAHQAFLSLCTTVRETRLRQDSPLGDMHDVGLLTTFIPEFNPVVGRVHHDTYHVLTVDAHSIAAVDSLRRLARGESAAPHGVLRRLAMEMARPKIVFLAVLLHDVGKAIGRKDHAVRGAPIAFEIAKRLGLSNDDAHEVAHLVRHHLALYHLATRRDIDDPDVIEEVTRIVHGREGLCELLLLTFVDVSTTSPDAMTEWKAALLERLFLNVEARLLGRSPGESRGAGAHARIERICRNHGDQGDKLCSFLRAMPERYVLGMDEPRIAAHAALAADRLPGEVRIAVFPTRAGALAEIVVLADDQPGLLAAIAAVLTANRFSVLEAQIHSRKQQDAATEAVDVFQIAASNGVTFEDVQRTLPRVETGLRNVLSGQASPDELVRPRLSASSGRPSPSVPTEVVVDNRASSTWTVVEAFTRDRPGLLYTLARTFRDLRLSIQLAKINTEGTRVADVFYVCDPDGSKVVSSERVREIERRLRESLDQPWEGNG
jgi:[protein-PII] uridylyltransferase